MKEIATFLIVAGLGIAVSQEYNGGHALFVRTPAARQQSDTTGYLPPYSTQRPPERPRPFQPPPSQQPSYPPSQNEVTNFPYQRPSTGISPPNQSPTYSTQKPTYLPPNSQSSYGPSSYNPRPTTSPSYPSSGSSIYPPFSSTPRPSTTTQTGFSSASGFSTNYNYASTSATNQYSTPGGFSTYGYPSQRPSSTYVPSSPSYPTPSYGYPSVRPTTGNADDGYPAPPPPPEDNSGGVSGAGAVETSAGTGEATGTGVETTDDDSKHPPHIHALDVQCSKTMMTINIEFNRAFDGVIYSKGFFMNPECRYVEQNSGQTKYSFTVSLNSCGTQFINDFGGEAGQAYLENVLVLQNEPGIQEVWDTVRRVRCLWEGNINKALSVNFSVDMLNQEIVTFSGDTAVAKLDIQVGRGPFAPAADGLVKIGETMTLVVSVEGDPGFDLQVRDCVARDDTSTNTVQLTDERGCILKPKLFGAFQKTNDTGSTGASIIAYAFFQAFKFPDVMDLFIECNVELCKTDCEPCPEANQQIEPGRRRRSIMYTPSNVSSVMLSDPVRVARGFRVIMVDDLSTASNQALEQLEETIVDKLPGRANVCMTQNGFYTAMSFLLATVFITTVSAVALYVKLQKVYRTKGI